LNKPACCGRDQPLPREVNVEQTTGKQRTHFHPDFAVKFDLQGSPFVACFETPFSLRNKFVQRSRFRPRTMITVFIFAYIISAVAACWATDRAARKHGVTVPNILWTCLGGTVWGMTVLLVFWPFIILIVVWSEISARQSHLEYQEVRKREREERARNPYADQTMEEQIDRLRELHHDLIGPPKTSSTRRPHPGDQDPIGSLEPMSWGRE